jgi:hypothetical protein
MYMRKPVQSSVALILPLTVSLLLLGLISAQDATGGSAASAPPAPAGPAAAPADAAAVTTVTVTQEVLVPDVKRLGINVGSRSRWGAAQFLKNLIDNPGFEAGVYGSVAHIAVGSSGSRLVQDFWDTSWNNDTLNIGQPEDFWNGADYEIVYGPAKGRSGTIADFAHENNRYVFYLDQDGTVPEEWDVLFVRREWDGLAARGQWATADPATTRPGSPGSQSLHLTHTGESWRASYAFYMDSVWRDGDRTAGKLFIVRGNWHLEFWARGAQDGDVLRARFFREGEADFFDETISLTSS